MKLERIATLTAADGHALPAWLVTPDAPRGGVLLLPPYGTTKEGMLGLAASLGEAGLAALAVDPCGHGQSPTAVGPGVRDEVEAALAFLRRFGPTAAAGVSLGGRLALMSSADLAVAISPSVVAQISPLGKWMFENFPSPSIREPYSGYVNELLELLGPVPARDRPCLLLYAERDIPGILAGAAGLQASLPGAELRHVTRELRPDVKDDSPLVRYLPRWFNHTELRLNAEAISVTVGWLAERFGQLRRSGPTG